MWLTSSRRVVKNTLFNTTTSRQGVVALAYQAVTKRKLAQSSTWASYKEEYRRDHQRIMTYNDPKAHKVKGRVFKPDSTLLPTHDPLPFPTIEGYNLKGEEVKVPVDQTCDVKLIGLSLRGGFDYVVRTC